MNLFMVSFIMVLFCIRKELTEKYEDKLTKELTGPTYEVLGKVMKVIINRKLTGPGSFIGYFNATILYIYITF